MRRDRNCPDYSTGAVSLRPPHPVNVSLLGAAHLLITLTHVPMAMHGGSPLRKLYIIYDLHSFIDYPLMLGRPRRNPPDYYLVTFMGPALHPMYRGHTRDLLKGYWPPEPAYTVVV